MKKKSLIVFSLLVSLFYSPIIIPQTDQFSVQKYKDFLKTHQNMSSNDLLQMYQTELFEGNINQPYLSALYFDSIDIKYKLTDYEKSLINKHGFMASERMSKKSFGQAFLEIYQEDLPVFVSTDAILHAMHISYDRILRDIELTMLIDKVKELLLKMHSKLPELAIKYNSYPQMNQSLRDVDVYLTIPRKLLDDNAVSYFAENNSKINDLLNMINDGEGLKPYSLFSESCVVYDWSQFIPRGHYDDKMFPVLKKYFKTMMWLGRVEIYLSTPRSIPVGCLPPSIEDIRRQTIDAFLINELVEAANVNPLYNEIENIISFFVGDQDNVTIPNIQYLKTAVGLDSASYLLNDTKLNEFNDSLMNQSFAHQKILSQILYSNPASPDSIIPASSFLLFGQRFVVDSYITANVVFDRIKYNNTKICRLYPSTLDPMFALGNDAAAQLLKDELDSYKYASNLASLRFLIDSYDNQFWECSLYNLWLNNIRKLNPPKDRTNLPLFMQTAAYWQEKLNTQLTSWAQLRHDNLLYAKQSYTGGTVCSYPYSYVEPFPEFYAGLKNYAVVAKDRFQNISLQNNYQKEKILRYFQYLWNISDTLFQISEKEINGTPLNDAEKLFLKKMVYDVPAGSGQPPFDGWYANLFYDDRAYSSDGFNSLDLIVADIHTVPTGCSGGSLGGVVHVGTGNVNLGVFVCDYYSEPIAFIGPVMSYHEFNTTNFKRLTDDEWETLYFQNSMRPSWVNLYLADKNGNSRGGGLNLITGVDADDASGIVPLNFILAAAYPNPFNPSTKISFAVPSNLSNSRAELVIYDVQGQVVKRLLNSNLPSGNYITKWDGTNEQGITVTSGTYIYNLRIADKQISGKLMLMK